MKTNSIKKLKEVVKKKIDEKDVKILGLENDLKEAKKNKRGLVEKTVLFEFPDSFNVENFPTEFKVLNPEDFKTEFPKSFSVENQIESLKISNVDEFAKAIIEAMPDEKEAGDIAKPIWVDGLMVSFFEGLAYLLGKITSKIFKVAPTADSFLTPQYVLLIDPKTGRPMAPVTNVHVNNQSMGGGGASNLANETIGDALDNYKVSDVDDIDTTKYYGFLKKDGGWYIMREDTVAKTFRYVKGDAAYTTAWTARASQTYNYFNIIF